ncbi:MAG: acyl-CoA thioesterase [Cyclobacteriaceae bacterium]|nr:acyl-CoA thioesterase [Cyclobacteriaceae bacterium]
MKAFEQAITVKAEHLDELNHVNNVVYLQWVQEVASAHWNSLASTEMKQRYSWVVLKHEIEYFAPAYLNDVINARTWVHHSEGVRSERHVELFNQKTGKMLIRAKTNWCLLDAQTMKPRRIERDILNVFH